MTYKTKTYKTPKGYLHDIILNGKIIASKQSDNMNYLIAWSDGFIEGMQHGKKVTLDKWKSEVSQ